MIIVNRKIDKAKIFRGGFTVLELLVASLLLGMLMTILTMIFNQSSIAWRTGEAGVLNMDTARKEISDVRNQDDNGYEWNGNYYIHSVFKDDATIASRTEYINNDSKNLSGKTVNLKANPNQRCQTISAPTAGDDGSGYIVNVMSYGPDRDEERYDNIYGISPINDTSEWW